MTATIKKQWGGARRKPKDFTPEMCERFARKVNELQPLWDTITDFFEREEYDPNCVAMVQKHSEFQKYSALCTSKVPRSLLKRVFKRKNEGGEEYWPSSFAILQAMLELKITGEYAISTLHKYRRKGNKPLRQRDQPNFPPKR